ncbi:ATP-binding protein [Sphingomonas aquatilis]
MLPRSIRGRLLLAALVGTSIALLFATFSIGRVLDRFVTRGMNERLDAQIALLARSVQQDGSIDRAMLAQIGPFTQHDRGWRWRIDAPGVSYSSREIIPRDELRERGRRGRDGRAREGRERNERSALRSAEGGGFYARTLRQDTQRGAVTITVAAPRSIIDRPRNAAVRPLLLSLAALAAFLLGATFLQLELGLRPLGRLRSALAAVRAGEMKRVPGEQPVELREVVGELNGLLDENEAALARARGHVANLAHSLKTPLATLSLRLKDSGRDPDGELAQLVEQIDHGIRHHLGRARAASPGAPGRPQLPLAAALDGIVTALARIHAERDVAAHMSIAPDLAVKCDPQDLDEMLGNLLDNAWKWAGSRIEVSGARRGSSVATIIDDDGPGLPEGGIAQALVPGRRLDERGDGHGFGLPIARELAELHGGALDLSPSPLGGLRVVLTLPA